MKRMLVPLLVMLLAAVIFGGNWWAARTGSSCEKSTDPCKCVVTISGMSAFTGSDQVPSCSVKLSLGNFTASTLSNCDTVEPGWFDRIVMCDNNMEARLDCGGKAFTVAGGTATRFSCGKDEYDQPAIETSKDPWTSNVPQRRKPKFGGEGDDALHLIGRIFAKAEEQPARDIMLTPTELVTVVDGDAGVESDGSGRRVTVAAGQATVENFCRGTVTTVTGPAILRVQNTPDLMAWATDPSHSMDDVPTCGVKDLSGRWRGGYSRRLYSGAMDSVAISIVIDGKQGTVELPDATLKVEDFYSSGSSMTLHAKAGTRELYISANASKGFMDFSVEDIAVNEKGSKEYRSGRGSAERLYIAHYGVPDGAVGAPYEARLRAFSPAGGTLTWRIADGTPPEGISLDSAGVLTGTPARAGSSRFTVEVADETGATFRQSFYMTIKKFVVGPAVLPDAVIGKPYSVTLQAIGANPPYTWRFLLPMPGVQLDSATGEVKIDSVPVTAAILAMVSDANGNIELANVSLPLRAIMILGSHIMPDAAVGQPYSYRFEAVSAAAVKWSITPDLSDAGFRLDPDTGELSGTPAQGGAVTIAVTARSGKTTESRSFQLSVTNPDGTVPAGQSCGACGRRR